MLQATVASDDITVSFFKEVSKQIKTQIPVTTLHVPLTKYIIGHISIQSLITGLTVTKGGYTDRLLMKSI